MDIYGNTPLMVAIKNDKNGSLVRLKTSGARLRERDEEDFDEISFDLLEAAQSGEWDCFQKYYKAGFTRFSDVRNIEGKSLAHVAAFHKQLNIIQFLKDMD